MPTERQILCGHVPHARPAAAGAPLILHTDGPQNNVRLVLADLDLAMWRNVPPFVHDLLDIAAYVYVADQAVSRGSGRDTDFGDAWRRRLWFRIAVRDPDRWNQPRVLRCLTETLSFLSDDEYHFEFVAPKVRKFRQARIEYGDPGDGEAFEEVALMSGGLDSLGGVVQRSVKEKRKLLLVQHRSNPKLNIKHNALHRHLCQHPGIVKPHLVPVRVNKPKGLTAETTQRSRSFLFMALAAALAHDRGLNAIGFYENGVVSLNLPPATQVVGGRATRTTHPRVLNGYSDLLDLVFPRPIKVENHFLWKTKLEVVNLIRDAGCADLIRHSVSCANTRRTDAKRTHCGICSQCIDRRFAVLAAGLAEADPGNGYEVDLLVGPRDDGRQKTMITVYTELANKIGRMALPDFLRRFGETARILRHTDLPAEAAASRVFRMYQDHSAAVTRVLDQGVGEYASRLRQRDVPASSLLRMVYGQVGGVAPPPAARPEEGARNEFRRTGAGWTVRFLGGPRNMILPSRGVSYLHELLRSPGIPARDVDVVCAVTRNPDLYSVSDGTPTVDRDGLIAYRVRLSELECEIEEAVERGDTGEQERATLERDSIRAEVRRLFGKGGRVRREGDERRKLSKAVSMALTRSIAEIRKYDPLLADHFDSTSLQRGKTLLYTPPADMEWTTD